MKNKTKHKMSALPLSREDAKRVRGGATGAGAVATKPVMLKKATPTPGWSLEAGALG